jgi:hypothetical protein
LVFLEVVAQRAIETISRSGSRVRDSHRRDPVRAIAKNGQGDEPKSDVAELPEIIAVHSFWHVDLLGDAVFDLLPLKSTWNLGEE